MAIPDTQIILIGEQIALKLELNALSTDTVIWPVFTDTIIKGVEIVAKSGIDTVYTGNDLNRRTLTQVLRLTSFDSGYYAIKPVPLMVNGSVMQTRPFLISVYTLSIDSTNAITDIKDIREDPLTVYDYIRKYWPYGVGILLVIALLVLLYRYRHLLKPKAREVSELNKTERPDEHALKRLHALKEQNLWQQGQIKAYHAGLSEIVREYLEGRYYFDALEKTTEEIMSEVRLTDISERHQLRLQRLLRLTDLVKFAKEHPLPTENEELWEVAVRLVEDTRNVVAESTQEKTNTESSYAGN